MSVLSKILQSGFTVNVYYIDFFVYIIKKSRIQEKKHILTDADRHTDTKKILLITS